MATKYNGSKKEKRALNALITLQRAADSVGDRCRTYKDANLTDSQFGTLDALYHIGPMNQKEIGKKNLKTEANMTTVIDNLEERNLVERKPDPDDRRCHVVSLTEKGKELFESEFPEHLDRVVEAFDVLTIQEQNTLIQLCKKVGRAGEESE